jgi:phosphatidylserine/phosphatidylglycerophosphate/cardiolipin synthase-like enzyme
MRRLCLALLFVQASCAHAGPHDRAIRLPTARNDCGAASVRASSGPCAKHSPLVYALAFAQNQHGQPETTCDRAICRQLLAAIDHATRSVDFAVYGVRSQPAIIAALVAAQARGVRVRGVVDTENRDCTLFAYPDTSLLMNRLAAGSVVCDVGAGYGYIMHNKFFVFDVAQVWTGSTNLSDTESGGEYNSDVAMLITSPALAGIYTAEFEEMFAGSFHRRKRDNTEHVVDEFSDGTIIESYFSPSDHAAERAVIPLIERSAATLDVAMFYITDAAIAAALLAAQARGVRVRVVLDAGGAANKYSKHAQLCAAGIQVKIENWGGKSHSKWAVADAGVPESPAVLFGSMNWTAAGDSQNDENTLYVRSARVAVAFQREFERQWADLIGVPACVPVRAEATSHSRKRTRDEHSATVDERRSLTCHGRCETGAERDRSEFGNRSELDSRRPLLE